MHLTARFYAGLYNQNESPLSRLHLAFVRESKAGLRMASVGLDSVERVINPKTPGDVFRLKVLSDNGVVPISRLAEISSRERVKALRASAEGKPPETSGNMVQLLDALKYMAEKKGKVTSFKSAFILS
ncbi:MAG: hypothetical protein H6853_05920 [Rhodospirillales bacterium]|nr:hypothetical protein [Alphaproteobacteria bacterium]USO03080.1 MAG: hypothetical protein H6853_05920 [Rhodospirillales bacterium]